MWVREMCGVFGHAVDREDHVAFRWQDNVNNFEQQGIEIKNIKTAHKEI
jgi:hypothetical protein